MEKVWTGIEKKDTKIIVINNEIIYFGNPKTEEFENIFTDLKFNIAPKKLFSLPISYINRIKFQEQSNCVEIFYRGNANDQLFISDKVKRDEIFEYLKTIRPNIQYSIVKLNRLQASKKPLIAFCVATAIFIWTLYIAIQLESGLQYEVIGEARSLATIVLGLASIGVTNVIFIFVPMMLIALTLTIRKMKNLPEFHVLVFRQ